MMNAKPRRDVHCVGVLPIFNGRPLRSTLLYPLLLVLLMSLVSHATPNQSKTKPPYSLIPRMSPSLPSMTKTAGGENKCSAVAGGWEIDYGGLATVVQQVDDRLCTLLAVRVNEPNTSLSSSNTSSLDVLGIDSVTGAVRWTVGIPGSALPDNNDYGKLQQVWLDAINQRFYMTGWSGGSEQHCSWVRAYQYPPDKREVASATISAMWKGEHCLNISGPSPFFYAKLLLWPWADTKAGGAPIALVDGFASGVSYYGSSFTGATLTLFDGSTGQLLHQSDAPMNQAVTVAACSDQHGDVQRLSWYHDKYWSWQGTAAMYDVHRNGSVQQLGAIFHWMDKSMPVWRVAGTEASCLIIRQDSSLGNYSVWDIPSGELLWTNNTDATELVTHSLNPTLLVAVSVSLDLRLWTIAYWEARSGSIVTVSPTIALGENNQTGGAFPAPQFQFDASGVLYTEVYLYMESQSVLHTWLALDVVTLQLINGGPTPSNVSESGFRPLSIDKNGATAVWQPKQSEPSTYTARRLNSTTAIGVPTDRSNRGSKEVARGDLRQPATVSVQ